MLFGPTAHAISAAGQGSPPTPPSEQPLGERKGAPGPEIGPEGSTMLIVEIAGNRYEQTSFDRRGRLTGRSRIVVGALRRASEERGVEVPLSITVFEPDGSSRKRFDSIWSCSRDRDQMVMPLLFMAPEAASRSRLRVEGDPILYPRELVSGRLPDIQLTLEPEAGALALFGGRSEVDITERHLTVSNENGSGVFEVTAQVELRVYALGIRVRARRFAATETVDPRAGLLRQVLRAESGSRTETRRLGEEDPAEPAPEP